MLYRKSFHSGYAVQPDASVLYVSNKSALLNCCTIPDSRVCTEATHGITFSGDDEEEVIAEILEYNYDERDIEHMIKVEGTNLFSHLQMLNQNCIKRT